MSINIQKFCFNVLSIFFKFIRLTILFLYYIILLGVKNLNGAIFLELGISVNIIGLIKF